MALASWMLQLSWPLERILWSAAGIFLGLAILGGLFTLLAALSFWIPGSTSLASPLITLMDFAQYPMDIYNSQLRFVLTFVIPLGFIAFYPSASILREGYQHYLWVAVALAAALGGGGYSLWRLGLRRYESAGH